MLTSSIIVRYGITGVWDRVSRVDDLFSGSDNDPHLLAQIDAPNLADGEYYSLSFALGIKNTLVTQIIFFKDKQGYERYLRDGITLFDDKEY